MEYIEDLKGIEEKELKDFMKKSTLLDAHKKKTGKGFELHKARELMEKETARDIAEEIK